MKRPLRPEETRLWAQVARTVRPRPGRIVPKDEAPVAPTPAAKPAKAAARAPGPAPAPPHVIPPRAAVDPIEPGRKRRIVRERDPIDARIDLHGLSQFAAEDRLKAFLRQCHAEGLRAVLVITGKGSRGGGIIRDWAPEWLNDASLRGVVAGFSSAHRRHGGEGALYVALKRRT